MTGWLKGIGSLLGRAALAGRMVSMFNLKVKRIMKNNFIYNVHFLIVEDSEPRHENYPFNLKKDADKFFKEKVKEEKQRIKEESEEWTVEKYEGIDFVEYDMYRNYATNIDRVIIRIEKLELN